ncbi:MAG: thioredoxin domain-containing protein [Anaerolineae bacterium]|nr:thioredoxin domain-containing protein [Anaerolineae bacterium]MDW8067610.1 thioredoxin domain-containing protein [Anaerolineae bacterium]
MKKWVLLTGVVLVLLAGCRQPEPVSHVPTAPPTSAPTSIPGPAACWAAPSVFSSLPLLNVPAVTAADWARGPADAPVTLIVYSDFQCPYCAMTRFQVLAPLEEVYPESLRIVYRHFPLSSIHDKAQITAEAAEAAGAQGKFWEMHDLLFTRQQEWASRSADEMPQVLTGYAQELGLNVEQFQHDLEARTYQAKVLEQFQEATALGLPGTPSFILNGRLVTRGDLITLVDEVLQKPRMYDGPPAVRIDPNRRYTAIIRTPKGEIGMELYAAQALVNVNSFVFLAREGWYDHTALFRGDNFVLQAGDPTGRAGRNPGFQCGKEISDLRFDVAGVVGVLGADPDTSNGRFFITLAPWPELNGMYTVIGKVVRGLNLLQGLPEQNPESRLIPSSLTIEAIRIEEQ